MGLIAEPHPLAVGLRTVNFLRDLDLDPAAVLGDDVVEAVDTVLAFPRQVVFRRTFRQAIAMMLPLSIRSQRAFRDPVDDPEQDQRHREHYPRRDLRQRDVLDPPVQVHDRSQGYPWCSTPLDS